MNLDSFKQLDKEVEAMAAEAVQKFSKVQLAHLWALNDVLLKRYSKSLREAHEMLDEAMTVFAGEVNNSIAVSSQTKEECNTIVQMLKTIDEVAELGAVAAAYQASLRGKRAVDKRHDKPGGAREKQAEIRKIWANGNYRSRDICAEQECAAMGMSFSSARKALRNTPNPPLAVTK